MATDYYNRIVERRPDDDSALAALETIYEQREENEQLYEVVLRRADLAQNAKAEQAMRRKAAPLASNSGASGCHRGLGARVVHDSGNQPEAVAALDGLYTSLAAGTILTNLLERRLELGVSAGVAIDLRFRLAEIQRVQLANRTGRWNTCRPVLLGRARSRQGHRDSAGDAFRPRGLRRGGQSA